MAELIAAEIFPDISTLKIKGATLSYGEINIAPGPGYEPPTAYAILTDRGLAIAYLARTRWRMAGYYTVTHIESGAGFGFCSDFKDALKQLKKMLPLADWTLSKETLEADESLRQKFKAAMAG